MQAVQGQARTLKIALEMRCNIKIGEGHDTIPWLVMYPSMSFHLCSVGEDGKTASERRRGKQKEITGTWRAYGIDC